MYRTTKMETDVRVHGQWKSTGVSATGESFQVSGEYLEVDPPRRQVMTINIVEGKHSYDFEYTLPEAP
jgi:uncharacterized protein YndB with AHSA1/START domain